MDRLFFFILLGMGFPTLLFGQEAECSPPFEAIGGHCIFVDSFSTGTWYEMSEFCGSLNAQLVKLDDANLFHDIVVYIHANGLENTDYWIGATKEGHDPIWRWEDGSNVKMGTPYWGYKRNDYQMPVRTSILGCVMLDSLDYFYFSQVSCQIAKNVICQFS
ncbi:C-type lectin domain family 7 member A-like isoform X2 [Macrobrachium rosenbergii]|uniref:C-type lectin domain family 7 member A-like isoform X2 n=1 Tax=Macrobrachium rosenbergii TaxID=79674 RepID=UPI0034D5489C